MTISTLFKKKREKKVLAPRSWEARMRDLLQETSAQSIARFLILWLSPGQALSCHEGHEGHWSSPDSKSQLWRPNERQMNDTIFPRSRQQRLAVGFTWPGSYPVLVSEPGNLGYSGPAWFHANSFNDEWESDLLNPLSPGRT